MPEQAFLGGAAYVLLARGGGVLGARKDDWGSPPPHRRIGAAVRDGLPNDEIFFASAVKRKSKRLSGLVAR